MIIVPVDVLCVVCKKIFCCAKCKQKHQASDHTNVLAIEKVNNCNLCKGMPLVPIDLNQNDAFVRHLCDKHLPLRCKKCSETIKTESDLKHMTTTKCTKTSLTEIPKSEIIVDNENADNVLKEIGNSSNIGYVTAVDGNGSLGKILDLLPMNDTENGPDGRSHQHQSVDNSAKLLMNPNFSDSVFSLRNCSSILQCSANSNRTAYGLQIQSELGKGLVRQTSTPMFKNVAMIRSPSRDNSSSTQMSSIDSNNSESYVGTESSRIVQEIHQQPAQSPMTDDSAPNKESSLRSPGRKRSGRNKMPAAVTPLRHVLSKSIQRAIREHGVASPTSPLDLRLSPVIRRSNSDPLSGRPNARADLLQLQLKSVQKGRLNFLATVYESARNFQEIRNGNGASIFKAIDSIESVNATPEKAKVEIVTCNSTGNSDDAADVHDIWHTPNECPSNKYSSGDYERTPRLPTSKLWPIKRSAIRFKEQISQDENEIAAKFDSSLQSNVSDSSQSGTNKWWSLFSSVFNFTTKVTQNEHSETHDNKKSPLVLKRCASFTDLKSADDRSESNDYQPHKIRRTNSIGAPLNGNLENVYRRIQGRPPISSKIFYEQH